MDGASPHSIPSPPRLDFYIQALRDLEALNCSTNMSSLDAQAGLAAAATRIGGEDNPTDFFFRHTRGLRIDTDAVITKAIKQSYPDLELVVVPDGTVQLLSFAAAGHATATPLERKDVSASEHNLPSSLVWDVYMPPASRLTGSDGSLRQVVNFGKFNYAWKDEAFIVYRVDGRDGSASYPQILNNYILTSDRSKAEALVIAAGKWASELHDEVWVWDHSQWQKSGELYRSVMKASWDSVILPAEMKKAIIDDHVSFFQSRDTYEEYQVPWKRGVIYHGPPGNGKTISIKAMMHTLYSLPEPVPTIYVRSLASFMGPEYSVSAIFAKARQFAPCYLVFEDLDSLVTPQVRSYFLNEIDGLNSNDGIFIVGSTNHLELLDPGISKRPSRFDRKYFFPDPNMSERIAYCQFWQKKLSNNKDLDFPDELCKAIAGITDGFSFAYIQEAFVATLLAIARDSKEGTSASKSSGTGRSKVVLKDMEKQDDWVGVHVWHAPGPDLDKLVLWVEIQKQIAILREGMDAGQTAVGKARPDEGKGTSKPSVAPQAPTSGWQMSLNARLGSSTEQMRG